MIFWARHCSAAVDSSDSFVVVHGLRAINAAVTEKLRPAVYRQFAIRVDRMVM